MNDKAEKRPVGRPRTTVDDLPQDWEQIIMDCGQEEGSAVEFLPNRRYTAVVTIGTEPNSRAVFNVDVRPVERGKD